MRTRAIASIGVLCGLTAIARADVIGPADAVSAIATIQAAPIDPSKDPVYICPMDPDVRSHAPGTCRRCGMTLQAGIPDPVEFHLDVDVVPQRVRAGDRAALQFFVHDPWKNRPVMAYNLVHERLFHAFVVSEDLQFFRHSHPTLVGDVCSAAGHISEAGHVSGARRLLSVGRHAATERPDRLRAR